MKNFKLSSKQIIIWICVNYGLFIMAFFTLGFMDSNKSIVIANFILDIVLCTISLVLNVILLAAKYKTPIVGKIGLLFATLCFVAFTCFVFLIPENGLPPVLFSRWWHDVKTPAIGNQISYCRRWNFIFAHLISFVQTAILYNT